MNLLILTVLAFSKFGFAYTYTATDEAKNPSFYEIYRTTSILNSLGYSERDLNRTGNIPFLDIDQIYSNSKGMVFLKTGLKPSDVKIYGKILGLDAGFVLHIKRKENYSAFYFYNLNKSEIGKIAEALKDSERDRIPAALGAPCCSAVHDEDANYKSKMTTLNHSVMSEAIGSCAITGLQAMKQNFKSKIDFLKDFSPSKFWKGVVSSVETIVGFGKEFMKNMKEFVETMTGVDLDILIQLGCSMAGTMIPSLIMKGFNVAALGTTVITMFMKLKKLKPAFDLLMKMKGQGKKVDSESAVRHMVTPMLACGT